MSKSCDSFFNGDKRAVFVVSDDHSFHDVAFLIFLFCLIPRVWTERLNRERHFAVFYLNHLRGDSLPYLKHSPRVLYEAPIHFRDVHETLQTLLYLYKKAEVNDAGDFSLNNLSDGVFFRALGVFFFFATLFRENELIFFRVGGKDEDRELFSDKLLKFGEYFFLAPIFYPRIMFLRELGRGEKPFDAMPLKHEPALVCFFYDKFKRSLFLYRVLCFFPDERLTGFLERKLHVPVLVFSFNDLCRDRISNTDFLYGIAGAYELTAVDDAGSNRSQVNIERIFFYRDYRAINEHAYFWMPR